MFLVNQTGLIRFPWLVINREKNLWAFRDNDVKVKDQGAWCVCSGKPNQLPVSGVTCVSRSSSIDYYFNVVSMFWQKYCIRAVKMASLHWRRGKTRRQVNVFKQSRCYVISNVTEGKASYQCQAGSLSHPMLALLPSCGHSLQMLLALGAALGRMLPAGQWHKCKGCVLRPMEAQPLLSSSLQ